MLLCGRLQFYQTIEWCTPFKVKVTACLTTIVPPEINPISTVYTMWYDDAIPVDLNPALAGYRQEPNCEYDMVFNVKYEKFPQTFPNTLYSLPAEAIYNSADQVVYLQKCSALGNPNLQDFECQGSPYEKIQTFVVIASLVGDPNYQSNVDVKFDFVIGDICIHDVVQVSQGLPDQTTYTIYSPAQSMQDGPIFTHTYSLCPMECMLTTDYGVIFDPASIDMAFNPLLPAINIISNNFDFSNKVYDLAISCASVKSTTGIGGDPSTETDFFSIKYVSQCYSEPIQRAFKQSYTISLYAEDARPFDSQAFVNPNCGPITYELALESTTGVKEIAVFVLTQ